MRRLSTVLILAALGLALPLLAAAQDGDIDKINGSVQVEAGQKVGDVSTVNGAVRIADGASVHKASTVNGSVELGSKTQLGQRLDHAGRHQPCQRRSDGRQRRPAPGARL
jgi:UDP-3-O-[3-hydroxymyristoyl] glucosamine N-acyltransferase